jgi:hypothetical protein
MIGFCVKINKNMATNERDYNFWQFLSQMRAMVA